jgi:predicted DNA-binding protein with PD1-like motif
MKILPYSGPSTLITIGFAPGEMLLESIREAIKDQEIINGAVISGIGTLKTCHLHYVDHTGFPPKDIFYKLEKPLELLNVSGLIADGEPHLHIMVSCRDNETYGGHLENKSEVLYLAEIAILVFNDHHMTRVKHPKWGIPLLEAKE